jgi:hypothetical protein
MADVFISYSRKDTEAVQKVRKALTDASVEVWIDEILEPGTPTWRRTLEVELNKAKAVVVILSPNAKKSQWVEAELGYAQTAGKRIFPFLWHGEELEAVPLGLIPIQYIDARQDREQALIRLVGAIWKHIGVKPTEKKYHISGHVTRRFIVNNQILEYALAEFSLKSMMATIKDLEQLLEAELTSSPVLLLYDWSRMNVFSFGLHILLSMSEFKSLPQPKNEGYTSEVRMALVYPGGFAAEAFIKMVESESHEGYSMKAFSSREGAIGWLLNT